MTTVPATILRHFTLKASDTSVHAEANAHRADWLMRIFVNEVAPPHARSQPGKCVQHCRRILVYTVTNVNFDVSPVLQVFVIITLRQSTVQQEVQNWHIYVYI